MYVRARALESGSFSESSQCVSRVSLYFHGRSQCRCSNFSSQIVGASREDHQERPIMVRNGYVYIRA